MLSLKQVCRREKTSRYLYRIGKAVRGKMSMEASEKAGIASVKIFFCYANSPFLSLITNKDQKNGRSK